MPFDMNSQVKQETVYVPHMTDQQVADALLIRRLETTAGLAVILLILFAFIYRRQIARLVYEASTTAASWLVRGSRLAEGAGKTFANDARRKADRS